MNRKRPHESPDCRCAACGAYDREEETTPLWAYSRANELYLLERDAWLQFLALCDLAARL
jgi:hypothetical protein